MRALVLIWMTIMATLSFCQVPARPGWTLVWSDEFNGQDGSRGRQE